MALNTHNYGGVERRRDFFDLASIAVAQDRRTTTYRCAGCGSQVAFDALIVTCRCIDELGSELPPVSQTRPSAGD